MTFSLWSKNGDTIKGTHWGKEKRYYSFTAYCFSIDIFSPEIAFKAKWH